MPHAVSPLELSRRLERAEGAANARFVEARARLEPALGACWTELAGAWALFHVPSDDEFLAIERFFLDRGAPVFHEVSPIAQPPLIARLHERGYHPVELTSVMYLRLADHTPGRCKIPVRIVSGAEHDLW